MGAEGGLAGAQVTQSLPDIAFLNCRPSVIAAAIVYAERRSRGIIPFWPSMLSKLSGYQARCSPCPLQTCSGAMAACVECLSSAGGGPAKLSSVHAFRLCAWCSSWHCPESTSTLLLEASWVLWCWS